MIREELASDPILAGRLLAREAAPVLAPHGSPALDPVQAVGLDLILEGFLAHHGTPLHLEDPDDRHVLAGDFCYASGLVRVAEAGDVEVIALLADLVARSAGLVAEGRGEALPDLWAAVTEAVARTDRADAVAALGDALDALDAGDDAPLAALAGGGPARDRLGEVMA